MPCGHSPLKQPPNWTLSVGKAKNKKRGFTIVYTSFSASGVFSWSVIMDELKAGGTQHYVMSEGRRQGRWGGGRESKPIPDPFAHKDINLLLTFWVFQSSMAYTFMTGFSRDGHRSLQIFQASINWPAQPERNNIQKAKMPEMSGGYGPAEKGRVERMETRCPTLRCMLIFTRLCLHRRHSEAFSVWSH